MKPKENAIDWKDDYYISAERKVLTSEELQIPGLQTFAWHNMRSAAAPLENHYHRNCMEITYVQKGFMNFFVGEKSYQLSGGDIFISKPDEVHSTNLAPLSMGEICWMQVNLKTMKEILFLNETASQELISRLLKVDRHVVTMENREMAVILKQAFNSCQDVEMRYMTASCLTLFLHKMLEYLNRERQGYSSDIEMSIAYIKLHIKEELTLQTLAEQCGLSVSRYKEKFKTQTGISPRNYINLQKMDAAKKMLRNGSDVTATAMELGFSTSNYFSTVFRKYEACSPTEYIKKMQSAFKGK